MPRKVGVCSLCSSEVPPAAYSPNPTLRHVPLTAWASGHSGAVCKKIPLPLVSLRPMQYLGVRTTRVQAQLFPGPSASDGSRVGKRCRRGSRVLRGLAISRTPTISRKGESAESTAHGPARPPKLPSSRDWRQDVSACAASRSEEHGRASAGAELRRCRTEGGQWRGGGEAEYFDPASILSTGKSESKRC